jgi:hypothetical protein
LGRRNSVILSAKTKNFKGYRPIIGLTVTLPLTPFVSNILSFNQAIIVTR